MHQFYFLEEPVCEVRNCGRIFEGLVWAVEAETDNDEQRQRLVRWPRSFGWKARLFVPLSQIIVLAKVAVLDVYYCVG